MKAPPSATVLHRWRLSLLSLSTASYPSRRTKQSVDFFQQPSGWWHFKYEIVEEPQPPAPNEPAALVIKALPDSKLEWYDPLHTGEPPPKQGTHRKYEHEHQSTPHMHLARLDLASQDEVLGFVNTWGLLGLWEVPDYQGFHPLVHPDRGFHEEFGSRNT
jgi:hypothetical protein